MAFVSTLRGDGEAILGDMRREESMELALDELLEGVVGDPTVALGTLVTATFILKLHDRLANLAAPNRDELALSLDEQRLPQRIRRPRP